MRIVHIMPDVDKEASGPSYSVMRLCEFLRERGDETELAVITASGVPHGKPFIRPFGRGFGPPRLGSSPDMRRWLVEQVASGSVDIVHNHSLWMMPNVYPGWATRGTNVPYVVSPRGTLSAWAMRSGSNIKRVFWPLLQRPAIRHAALFHATAISEYEDIRRLGFRQPVAVIPNGIDLPEFRQKPARSERTLLFLGRLHPIKGIEFLLQAWKELHREFPDWRLRIVGPGESAYVEKLKQHAEGLQRIEFSGPLYGQDKFEAFRSADLYVLPTHSENFGMTVAESLACGTPAVVSQGAPWQQLESQRAGWWPEIGAEPLLASLRQAMAGSREGLDNMGANGRDWMARDFSWSGVVASMHASYAWLAAGGDAPACVILD